MKKLKANDPRFTAKALNEKWNGSDRIDVDPANEEEFEELQEFADLLKNELKSEDGIESLDSERIEKIKTSLSPRKQYNLLRFPVWISTVAATLAVGFVTLIAVRTWQTGDSIAQQEIEVFSQEVMSDGSREELSVSLQDENVQEASQLSTLETAISPKSFRSEERDRLSELDAVVVSEMKRQNIVEMEAESTRTDNENNIPLPAIPIDAFQSTDPAVILSQSQKDNLGLGAKNEQTLPPLAQSASPDSEYRPTNTLGGSRLEMKAPEGILAKVDTDDTFLRSPDSVAAPFSADRELALLEERRNRALTRKSEEGPERSVSTMLAANEPGAVGGIQSSSRSKGQSFSPPPIEGAIVGATIGRITRTEDAKEILPAPIPLSPSGEFKREGYSHIVENEFKNSLDHPLSTFSIDVDTASYANVRRFINQGQLPPADAVRIEEMVNYFNYDYAEPTDNHPFATHIDISNTPWKPEHQLVRIGLKGKEMDKTARPAANLVFLVDVSGSMSAPNKLPWVKESLKLLTEQMGTDDRVAIVVYAGASGLALPSTTANNKETILHALDRLKSGGSTNGGAGIELAYKVAADHFVSDGINRVILCTDGDFNVGATDQGSLTRLIEEKAKTGVFFSAIGYGMGNYQDSTMEQLSNKGNGNYAYIDSLREASKVFVEDLLGTLVAIAKDVKIQVEFNPAKVNAYRLIGYENRKLAKEDFNDDTKDAGEIGSGHTVTALYEIVPAGVELATPSVDPLKYQTASERSRRNGASNEWLTVKLRYKEPDADVSQLLEFPFSEEPVSIESASSDLRFAASVAGLGMLLRDSKYKEDLTFADVIALAESAKGNDQKGRRSEFVGLVRKARDLSNVQNGNGTPMPVPEPRF